MKPKQLIRRFLNHGTTLRLVVTLAPLSVPKVASAVDQRVVSINAGIFTTEIYDGYDPDNVSFYTPVFPHFESSGQRDALFINSGATLTLESGANVWIKNDNDLTAFMRVGAYGSDGTLIVQAGSILSVGQSSRYANLQIGQGSGVTGTVVQNGGQVSVRGSMNVGVNGGTGSYTVNGGTLTLDHADDAGHTSLFTIGFNNDVATSGTSTGTFNLAGGRVEILAVRPVGTEMGNSAFILGNRVNTALSAYGTGASGAGNGVLNQTGGVFSVGAGAGLYLSGFGNGEYNLNGGTLEIGGNSLQAKYGGGAATGTYAFNFGGGTLKVVGSDLNTSIDANLVGPNTSSVIDTNGNNATWGGNLSAAGLYQYERGGTRLIKTGEGELSFTGATRTLDTFAAVEGVTSQSAGATSAVEFMVGSGANSVAEYQMNGGSLTINASADNTAGSFRVGDFGGTGTFTQNQGTVTVTTNGALNIGNQGGSGTYNLNGGSLNLAGGLNTLGRSAVGKPISHGELNLSGGALNLSNNSSLILGNSLVGATLGTGVLTQTGGVLSVGAGSTLFVSGYGDGTYNLNGGTLEVGGNGLQARYNNTTSNYAFNFGGGTLKVVGSDLNTSVDANLVGPNTSSVIDTNGNNATWGGNLSGAGLYQYERGGTRLIKTGEGELSFTGATRTLDTFAAVEGVTSQSAGATSAVEFMVGSGANSVAEYQMNGGSLTINASADSTAGSFRVGDFSGSGTFTQNGGTVNVLTINSALNIGNQGGNGTYNLQGGELNLEGLLNVLGRSQSGKPASHGELNVSGGTLNVASGASLILGNNIIDGLAGTGAVNQTGGLVKVHDGASLFVSGYGAGTYNLNGGTLEIGGDSLHAHYGNSIAASNFNLGGGTLKVTGIDLMTDVVANTSALTNSTINTNGLNASFAGFTGSGTLTKVGLGTLESRGTTTLGGLVISQGVFRANHTLTVGSGGITVASGAKLDANTTINAAPGSVMMISGTLGGSGTFGVATTILSGGTFAPGNSPGTVNVVADFTVSGGATFAWDLTANSESGAGVTFDLVTLSGANFTLENGAIFNVVLGGSADYANTFWLADHSWTVVDNDGTGHVVLDGEVVITSNQTYSPYGTFTLDGSNGDLTLNWTAVPEPSALLLLTAAIPLLTRRRRVA